MNEEVTAERVAQALDDAADLILVHGWGQGGPLSSGEYESLCVQQAIAVACGLGRLQWDVTDFENACPVAIAALEALKGSGYVGYRGDVYGWNDDRDRTEDEIHDALRNTSKALREEAGAA